MQNIHRRRTAFARVPGLGLVLGFGLGLVAALGLSAGCGAAGTPAGSVSGKPGANPCAGPNPSADAGAHSARDTRPVAGEGFANVLAATDIDGRVVGPAGPDKQATVVVVFASWCGPCRHELALLGELRTEEPRLRVIGVNAFEEWGSLSDQAQLRAFLAVNAPWLQVVHGDDQLLTALGSPSKIPTLFVFNGQGELVASYLRRWREPPTKQELADTIALALPGASAEASAGAAGAGEIGPAKAEQAGAAGAGEIGPAKAEQADAAGAGEIGRVGAVGSDDGIDSDDSDDRNS